jgi:hypothetical protein
MMAHCITRADAPSAPQGLQIASLKISDRQHYQSSIQELLKTIRGKEVVKLILKSINDAGKWKVFMTGIDFR